MELYKHDDKCHNSAMPIGLFSCLSTTDPYRQSKALFHYPHSEIYLQLIFDLYFLFFSVLSVFCFQQMHHFCGVVYIRLLITHLHGVVCKRKL